MNRDAMAPTLPVHDVDFGSCPCFGSLYGVERNDLIVRDLEDGAPHGRSGIRRRRRQPAMPSVAFDRERETDVFQVSDKPEVRIRRNRKEIIGSNASVVREIEQKRLPGAGYGV